jgi:hypothetical protein
MLVLGPAPDRRRGQRHRPDRWRPGFASSEWRVREELADAAADAERYVFSWELSFVPAQRPPKFEAHGAHTRVLIAERKGTTTRRPHSSPGMKTPAQSPATGLQPRQRRHDAGRVSP